MLPHVRASRAKSLGWGTMSHIEKQACLHKGQVQEVEAIQLDTYPLGSNKLNHFHLNERLVLQLSFLDLSQLSELLLMVLCGLNWF